MGELPPPASLGSVAITSTSQSTIYTSPLSAISPNQPLLPHHPPVSAPSQELVWQWPPAYPYQLPGSSSQPGLSLSPAAEPVPSHLVQRIRTGSFVEMRDLLADNIALQSQLSSLQGPSMAFNQGGTRPRLREVPSLISWVYCFSTYMAVRTSDPLTRDMLAYTRLIIREALRHGGNGWLDYDRVFRKHTAINPAQPWNVLLPSLQASTLVSSRPQLGGKFCTLCQECDHSTAHCALSAVELPVAFTGPVQSPKSTEACIAWNKGGCYRTTCRFVHMCATCGLHHKAAGCPSGVPYNPKPIAPRPKPLLAKQLPQNNRL